MATEGFCNIGPETEAESGIATIETQKLIAVGKKTLKQKNL